MAAEVKLDNIARLERILQMNIHIGKVIGEAYEKKQHPITQNSSAALTTSSLAKGEWLQMMSFTLTHTGNATPFSTALPFTFLLYSFPAWALMTVSPNWRFSIAFASECQFNGKRFHGGQPIVVMVGGRWYMKQSNVTKLVKAKS